MQAEFRDRKDKYSREEKNIREKKKIFEGEKNIRGRKKYSRERETSLKLRAVPLTASESLLQLQAQVYYWVTNKQLSQKKCFHRSEGAEELV